MPLKTIADYFGLANIGSVSPAVVAIKKQLQEGQLKKELKQIKGRDKNNLDFSVFNRSPSKTLKWRNMLLFQAWATPLDEMSGQWKVQVILSRPYADNFIK